MLPTTRGARMRAILAIAWPLILANSFWNLQLTIDRIYLGRFSTDALAAAIAVMGVFWTPMALVQQTASYAMTFIAQYLGAKREERVGASLWQAVYISAAGGIAVLGLIPLAGPLFDWIGHSPHVRPLEVELFRALCFSALPTALVGAAGGFFTGLGQTRNIMWVNCVALGANAVFGYGLIFGVPALSIPAMGVTGAGLATALANAVAAAFGFSRILTRENEKLYRVRSAWRWDGELMRRFIRYGVPSGMQWALEGLAFTFFLAFVGRMPQGDAALAGSGIVVTVMLLAVLPAMGVAQAVSVLVGQNLGKKDPETAAQWTWTGLQVAALYIGSAALTFLAFPEFYASWFKGGEAAGNAEQWLQVSAIVFVLLKFVAVFVCFDCMNLIFSFALKGAGDTRFVTLIALTLPWPLMVGPTWILLQKGQGVFAAWLAASVFAVTQAMVFWRRFAGGKWKSMSVIEEVPT